jgi:Cof subfamily protein (haloacid dehalogenase superfamily)
MVYVSDLDGTLLRDDASLSDYSRAALSRLLRDGIDFTVASARSVVAMRKILKGLTLRLPVIEFNGAMISDLASGHHHVVNDMDRSVVESVCKIAAEFGCVPFVSTFNGCEDRLYYSQIANSGMRWYRDDRAEQADERLTEIDDLRCALRDSVVCLTIVGRAGVLEPLDAAIGKEHAGSIQTHRFENRYSEGWWWLTVHEGRATKERAIRVLLEDCGLSDSKVTVFGDSINDLGMFRMADRAIAVGNASEELKAHATSVIGPNSEDSVVGFLEADLAARADRVPSSPRS